MMDNKILYSFVLIVSIVGVIALSVFDSDVDVISVHGVQNALEGQEVSVFGKVTEVYDSEKVMFLVLAEEKIETIPITLFKSSPVPLKEGDTVKITGSVEVYNGKKQIVGNRVERKN